MNKFILYSTFLITTTISSTTSAQNRQVNDIEWSITAQIPPSIQQAKSIGLAGAANGIVDHHVLIVGGTNFPDKMPWEGGKKKYYDEVFLFKQSAEGLQLVSSASPLKLPYSLAYGATGSTPMGMVIAGGENENGLLRKVLLLNYKAGQLQIDYLPELPTALTNAALTVMGNHLYLAGGEIELGATDQFLTLNLKDLKKGWVKLPNLPIQASHAVLLAGKYNDHKEIYFISGRKRNQGDISTIYKNFYSYEVKTGVWKEKKELPYQVSAATGIMKGNSILMFSGDQGETFHRVETLIAAIDREKDPQQKEILNAQKTQIQSNHPGFTKSVLKYDLTTDTWSTLNSLMPYGTVTTNAVLFNNEVLIAGGEVKAGVRTPQILVGKLISTK